MRNALWLSFSLLLVFALTTSQRASAQSVAVPGGNAHLTFADEFDKPTLDRSRWSTNYTNVLATLPGELQIYTPDSFSASQGQLKIRAEKRSVDGFAYTSGAMTTFGSFTQAYGYFEIRARVPSGAGLWPALWMLPADKSWPPEIDILEFLGRDKANVWMTYHWVDGKGAHQKDGGGASSPDWTADFHTYGLQWRPGLLVWYIDAKEVKRVQGTHVASDPMFLLLNLAIGGDWAGPPNASTRFPATFDIDYVRAYQYDDLPVAPPKDIRYLTASANLQVVSPGRDVTFRFGIDVAKKREPIRVQPILVDSTGKRRIAANEFVVPMTETGKQTRDWTLKLPEGLPKGLYVLSIGLFNMDWSQIDWLNNATTILVQ